jgi:putative tricarboxylic transport membrane protein
MTPRARRMMEAAAMAMLAAAAGLSLLLSVGLGLGGEETPGPGLFPAAAAALLLLLLAPLALGWDDAPSLVTGGEETAGVADPGGWRRLGLYVLGLGVAAVALEPIGFALGVGAALVVVLRFAERLAWPRAALVSVGGVVACLLLFDQLLDVPLPRGAFWPG